MTNANGRNYRMGPRNGILGEIELSNHCMSMIFHNCDAGKGSRDTLRHLGRVNTRRGSDARAARINTSEHVYWVSQV